MNENPAHAAAPEAGGPAPALRRDNLALIYQEILTALTRLRSNRQALPDAAAFRNAMKSAVVAAEADAARKGYTNEDARLASFAVVAFIDETVTIAKHPNFASWARQPLQEELFGGQTSGEVFFEWIDRLLARGTSPQDADVLEVFGLCLLLGYRGNSGEEKVHSILTSITNRVQQVRGSRPLTPDWAPQPDAVLRPTQDPWVRALALGTLGAFFLAVLFFVGFKVALLSGASALHSLGPLAPH